ncbi:hypothetical protein [uncultured Tenacibaculum sp.]|uniref:hypothetical protein n=1 Tax=uncultured Tenacibaculum sp. TaxID=174713 RepID=UPI00261733BB|nr:hypothetical protein [uncultured Tenacibaculum sp.]
MRIQYFIAALIFGMFFVACKQEKEPLLKDYLIGNWETTYLKIEYLTANETDSTSVFEDDFSKPTSGKAQSSYKNDGTFTAWFVQPDGQKIGETTGKWETKGDSLFVDYLYLGNQVQAWYTIKITENGFEAASRYDWDNDGEKDDTLLMKTKRIKP